MAEVVLERRAALRSNGEKIREVVRLKELQHHFISYRSKVFWNHFHFLRGIFWEEKSLSLSGWLFGQEEFLSLSGGVFWEEKSLSLSAWCFGQEDSFSLCRWRLLLML